MVENDLPIPKVLLSALSSDLFSLFKFLFKAEGFELETEDRVRLRPLRFAKASEMRAAVLLWPLPVVAMLECCDVDGRKDLLIGDFGRCEEKRRLEATEVMNEGNWNVGDWLEAKELV